jgi:hypothetical protein
MWKDALVAILNNLGPGKYVYGSEWSTEVARDRELQGITGLTIKKVRPLFLEVVEFESWPDWDSYWHSISANARRNYNKIKKGLESSEIIISDEAYRIKDTIDVLSIKRTMFERKKLSRMISLTLMRHAFRYALLKKNIRSTICRKGLIILGFATCIDVGKHIFYLEGGSQQAVAGVGWYTLLNTIHDAFDRTGGTGAFVMGPVEEETLAKAGWSGLARSRESCRATKREQATVTFQWARMADRRLS